MTAFDHTDAQSMWNVSRHADQRLYERGITAHQAIQACINGVGVVQANGNTRFRWGRLTVIANGQNIITAWRR